MKRIKKFGILQTAKVVSILYVALTAVIFIPMGVIMLVSGTNGASIGAWFTLLAPILYGLLGFFMTALGAFAYNFVAQKIGGIEIELE